MVPLTPPVVHVRPETEFEAVRYATVEDAVLTAELDLAFERRQPR